MKTKTILLSILTLVSGIAGATNVIDARRVSNLELNACTQVLHQALPKNGFSDGTSSTEDLKVAELIFLEWLSSVQCPSYMREFDTSTFYYQFLESSALGGSKTGVFLIIPDGKINPDFYTVLGSGLEIPGTRCLDSHCSWINNGEIFSFVIDKETKTVETFKNWRFEQEYESFNPVLAYYSQLSIHFKCKPTEAEKTTIIHYVSGEKRTEIPAWEEYPILLPKGKISVLIFYSENQIKGVLCFDMTEVSKGCPLKFESTVYLKERLGYERILYAQPNCEGTYFFSLLEKTKFEGISNLKWENISKL